MHHYTGQSSLPVVNCFLGKVGTIACSHLSNLLNIKIYLSCSSKLNKNMCLFTCYKHVCVHSPNVSGCLQNEVKHVFVHLIIQYKMWFLRVCRNYIFPAQSREVREECGHMTKGIDIYVTSQRVIFLDSQVYTYTYVHIYKYMISDLKEMNSQKCCVKLSNKTTCVLCYEKVHI